MPAPIKKKAPLGAIDRIAALEKTTVSIVQNLNQLINQINERLSSQAEVINACAKKLGSEEIEKLVQEERDAQDAVRVAAAEKYIKDQVEAGNIVTVETMSATSVVIGVEYDAEGNAVKPGRIQIPFSSVLPDLQGELLGKGVGTKVETKGGTTFEVLEIYESAPPKPESPTAPAEGTSETASVALEVTPVVDGPPGAALPGDEDEANTVLPSEG